MQEHSIHAVQVLPVVFILVGFVVGILLNILLVVWPFCKIFSKAGYHWAMGILMIIPVANLVMPFVLAFSDWPVLKSKQD